MALPSRKTVPSIADLSIVVPVYNEAPCISRLVERLIKGAYGSAVVIDTQGGDLVDRFYEVGTEAPQDKPRLAYQYAHEENSEAGPGLQRIWPSDRRYQPDHLWGPNRVPPSRRRYIEMGLMESNLE